MSNKYFWIHFGNLFCSRLESVYYSKLIFYFKIAKFFFGAKLKSFFSIIMFHHKIVNCNIFKNTQFSVNYNIFSLLTIFPCNSLLSFNKFVKTLQFYKNFKAIYLFFVHSKSDWSKANWFLGPSKKWFYILQTKSTRLKEEHPCSVFHNLLRPMVINWHIPSPRQINPPTRSTIITKRNIYYRLCFFFISLSFLYWNEKSLHRYREWRFFFISGKSRLQYYFKDFFFSRTKASTRRNRV